MNSLNYFDIIVMALFAVVSFSIYKMLKPESIDKNMIPIKIKSGKIVKLFKNKKELQNFVMENIKNNSLEGKVLKLSKIDKSFDSKDFLMWSKDTFESIFKSFYSKHIEKIRFKVSDPVFKKFEDFNNNLEENKQTITAEIVRFKNIIIKDITFSSKKTANIFVEFITEQTAVVKNATGKILKGDDNQIETLNDLWCFSKDYSSKKPTWVLTKTIEC